MSAVTFFCFIAASFGNLLTSERAENLGIYAIGSILLASPFLVLLAGHITLARTWRRHAFFVFGNLLLVPIWFAGSFAIRWFKPGWPGVLLVSLVLSIAAGLYVLCGRFIRERHQAELKT